jgi:hypothetical protein
VLCGTRRHAKEKRRTRAALVVIVQVEQDAADFEKEGIEGLHDHSSHGSVIALKAMQPKR